MKLTPVQAIDDEHFEPLVAKNRELLGEIRKLLLIRSAVNFGVDLNGDEWPAIANHDAFELD